MHNRASAPTSNTAVQTPVSDTRTLSSSWQLGAWAGCWGDVCIETEPGEARRVVGALSPQVMKVQITRESEKQWKMLGKYDF